MTADIWGQLMANNLQQAQIEQQKQAIAAGLQQFGSHTGFANAEGPPDVMGNFQQQLMTLPGLMPEQANAIAGAIQANPQMGQALLGRLMPQQQELTNDIKGYQQARGMGLIPQDMDYTKYLAMVKQPLVSMGGQLPYKIPENYTLKDPSNPMAGVVPIPGSSADPNSPNYRKFTADELTAAGFANMMGSAEDVIGSQYKGYSPINVKDAVIDKSVGLAGNFAVSPEYQGYMQLANTWIRAKLRQESGAVIGKDEWIKEYETYFPVVGDTQKTIEQKAKFRAEAIKNMAVMSQGAYDKNYPKTENKQKNTWTDGGYEYRKLPDGRVQRRKM